MLQPPLVLQFLPLLHFGLLDLRLQLAQIQKGYLIFEVLPNLLCVNILQGAILNQLIIGNHEIRNEYFLACPACDLTFICVF